MDLPAKRAEHPWTRICFEHLRGVDAALRFGGCAGRGLSLRFAGRLLLRAYPAAGALEALDPERNNAMPLRPLLIFLAMQAAAYPAAAQQNAPLTWWTTHSMQKVRPNDPMPFPGVTRRTSTPPEMSSKPSS